MANRGEIAVRIFRACYDLGLHTVAIYSNEDTYSLFRTKADEAYLVGENKSPLGAYLDIPGIMSLARRRGVTASCCRQMPNGSEVTGVSTKASTHSVSRARMPTGRSGIISRSIT